MKRKKRNIALILALIIIINLPAFIATQVFAHSAMLDVSYDDCESNSFADGVEEMWYALEQDSLCPHLSHEEDTIKYYFKENFLPWDYKWTDDVSEAVAEEIKSAFAASMEKWNNVYFYSYNTDGSITKNKVVNVEEGTESDHNLLIVPVTGEDYTALTSAFENSSTIIENTNVEHKHYSEWYMEINIDHFYEHDTLSATEVDNRKSYVGAHELGHVLGLRDADICCNTASTVGHHGELLMGYGITWSDITYKDIAGVAIVRGFHTDADHEWLSCGLKPNGKYKWLCSICNGTKEATNSGFFPSYADCGGRHNLSDGNMMAVASYGTKDYYKCRFCKYVASYKKTVEQNYVIDYVDATQHRCTNTIEGLNYYFYEPHNYIYKYIDKNSHSVSCSCTEESVEPHWVKQSELVDDTYGVCSQCGAIIDLRGGIIGVNPFNIAKVSVNGSYLLPSGVAVIADADVEAYLNGTLVFYDPADLPVTQ